MSWKADAQDYKKMCEQRDKVIHYLLGRLDLQGTYPLLKERYPGYRAVYFDESLGMGPYNHDSFERLVEDIGLVNEEVAVSEARKRLGEEN